jgi:hypothetical protein
MTEPMSGPVPRCPWCSAAVPEPSPEQCPFCGAQLVGVPGTETEIRGVTTLDAEAILRARSEVNRPRNRLLSLLTGDEVEAASAREHQESLAQPSASVRREMQRIEMEARLAAQEAERAALRADAMAQLGISLDDLAAAEAASLASNEAGEETDAVAATGSTESGPNPSEDDGAWPDELQPVDGPQPVDEPRA